MTIEEKLNKAIEFIKHVEKLELDIKSSSDIINDAVRFCEMCDDPCTDDVLQHNEHYVKLELIEELKDKAWHLLVDLTD